MIKRSVQHLFYLSLVLWFSVSFCAAEDSVDIHGFISQGYMKTTRNNYVADSTDGTFQFNEMGINFGYQPMDKLLIAVQFFARDFGSVGNDEIQVDYALADFRMRDYLGIRAGRIKNAMGTYSEYRDIDMLRTCIFLPFSVYDENLRDSETYIQGAGFYGDINTPRAGSFSYQAAVGTNNISADSATAVFLGYNIVQEKNIEVDTIYTYALKYSDPTGYFKLSGTAFFAELSNEASALPGFISPEGGEAIEQIIPNIEIYTATIEFIWDGLALTYEYKSTKTSDCVLTWTNSPMGRFEILKTPVNQEGWYVMLNLQITEKLAGCLYNDRYYPFKNDKSGRNPLPNYFPIQHWSEKWSLSFKYDITPSWVIKTEVQYIDGAASNLSIFNTEHGQTELKEHWWLYAAKMTYNF